LSASIGEAGNLSNDGTLKLARGSVFVLKGGIFSSDETDAVTLVDCSSTDGASTLKFGYASELNIENLTV
jgi:hypothetical protein